MLSSPIATGTVGSPFAVGVVATTDTTFEGTVFAVVTASGTAPTGAQVEAGLDNGGSPATASGSAAVSNAAAVPELYGLAAEGSYYIHVVQKTSGGTYSNVVTTAQFTTASAQESAEAAGATTGSGFINPGTNEGTVFWVVTDSVTTPETAEIQAGQDDQGSPAADSGSVALTTVGQIEVNASGLLSETEYFFHFQYRGPGGEDSAPITTNGFTTLASGGGGDVILAPGIIIAIRIGL